MSINISHTNSFQFENREHLRNTAKDILSKNGSSSEAMQKIIDKTIFDMEGQRREIYTNPQLAIIKASSQISVNNSLKETLKYLKSQANKKIVKEPVLGELWDLFEDKREEVYQGELLDFEIDSSAKNIFIAA